MKLINIVLSIALLFGCSLTQKKKIKMTYKKSDFETVIDGKSVRLFTMENENGMLVTLTNYGAKIVSIFVPDKKGRFADVMLGFNSIEDYQQYSGSHGAVVGPFANRIANAQFTIDGETYQLPVNNGNACLHSGPGNWSKKAWDYEKNGNNAVFTLNSLDGENGFPGNKTAKVTYTLTNDNELKIDYEVATDKSCHINVTNHGYFNLKGEGNGNVLNHVVVVNANKVIPVNNEMIPTGEIKDIRGTALDFTTPFTLGERIKEDDEQLKFAGGYDFNYVINKKVGDLAFAASVYEPKSRRYLECFTTEPGVQLYTANHFAEKETGKSGKAYVKHGGFCLETQHFPDSPNQPHFPSTLLKAGETYYSTTIYKFSVKK